MYDNDILESSTQHGALCKLGFKNNVIQNALKIKQQILAQKFEEIFRDNPSYFSKTLQAFKFYNLADSVIDLKLLTNFIKTTKKA